MAVQQWCREQSSALVPDSGVAVTESVARDRRSAFIHVRTLLETKVSCSSLKKWVAAAHVDNKDIQNYDFKKCFQTMVSYEQLITKTLLEHGSVFRLQADGRKRVYQVEIGAVLWKFPVALEPVRADLAKSGCISCLGARGPWVAERLIGMHEFPSEMHLDGKASMVEDAVRNATLGTERGGRHRTAPAHLARHESVDKWRGRPRCRSCTQRWLFQRPGMPCMG